MRSLSLRQFSASTLCALGALAGGLLSGAATVHGLRENSYGPANPPALVRDAGFGGASANEEEGGFGGYQSDNGDDDTVSAGCYECSERDLGYRWAAMAAVRLPAQCPADSWGFRRGCLDFIGGV